MITAGKSFHSFATGRSAVELVDDGLNPDGCDTRTAHAEYVGGGRRYIDNAPADKGAAIIDAHDDAPLIAQIGDPKSSTEWQAAMRRGQ